MAHCELDSCQANSGYWTISSCGHSHTWSGSLSGSEHSQLLGFVQQRDCSCELWTNGEQLKVEHQSSILSKFVGFICCCMSAGGGLVVFLSSLSAENRKYLLE